VSEDMAVQRRVWCTRFLSSGSLIQPLGIVMEWSLGQPRGGKTSWVLESPIYPPLPSVRGTGPNPRP
jgi:hypothetical protein